TVNPFGIYEVSNCIFGSLSNQRRIFILANQVNRHVSQCRGRPLDITVNAVSHGQAFDGAFCSQNRNSRSQGCHSAILQARARSVRQDNKIKASEKAPEIFHPLYMPHRQAGTSEKIFQVRPKFRSSENYNPYSCTLWR